MRSSDWSSDVCSSDLFSLVHGYIPSTRKWWPKPNRGPLNLCVILAFRPSRWRSIPASASRKLSRAAALYSKQVFERQQSRSEEHTSELQSLLRISYAVFCLKKKNKNNSPNHHDPLHTQYSSTLNLDPTPLI